MATTLDTILYGSQNLRLDIPESDRDYKIVMAPSFSDLYARHELNKQLDDHYSILDVRTFCNGLKKGNPNCIEFLFSSEHNYTQPAPSFYSDFLACARAYYKNGYVKQVWPQFVSAVKGIALNGIKHNPSPKLYARAAWWYNFLAYTYNSNYSISDDSFSSPEIWQEPRQMREQGICSFDISLFDNYSTSAAKQIDVGLFGPEFLCMSLVKAYL